MYSSAYRKVLVAMTCALALGAVGSASASASSWWVGGSELGSSEPLAAATTKVNEFRLTISAPVDGKIACQGVELKGADIISHSGGSIEHLILKKCVYETTLKNVCVLKSTTIESKALTLEAKLGSKSPEDELVVKPASGEVLAEIPFEYGSSTCLFNDETVKLTGKAQLVLPKGREEAVEQPLHFTSSGSELRFAGTPAELTGEYKLKLSSGKGWSYH
jgi:hypothetical protein